jgi:hypothetical protein
MLNIRRSRMRRGVALVATLAFVALQGTIAVHACIIDASERGAASADQAAAVANDSAAMPDCSNAAGKAAADVKICAAHCTAGAQVDTGSLAAIPPLAPQSALTVSVALPALLQPALARLFVARSGAPPPQLLFTRFLI